MSGGATSLVDGGVCTTNLSHYRALLHIIAYASQKQHSPAKIVQDALVGGVLHAVRDVVRRGDNNDDSVVILPVARCIAALAPLIATGYFVPSLSATVEGSTARYNMVCEGGLRDVMTVIVLLFPECFADGPSQFTEEQSRSCLHDEQGTAGKADSAANANCDDDNSNKTPEVQRHRAHIVTEGDEGAHVSCLTVRVSNDDKMEADGQTARLVSPWNMATSLASQSQRHARSDAVAEEHNINEDVKLRPLTDVNVVLVHESRVRVAVLLLAALNDAMHDTQYRLLKYRRTTTTGKTDGAAGLVHGATEDTILQLVTMRLQQAKMLLLCCIYATETSHRPPSRWLPRKEVQSNGTASSDNGGDLFARSADTSRRHPRHVFAALPGAAIFARPVEQWGLSTSVECNAWYDAMLEQLGMAYSAESGARQPYLETLLRQVKSDVQCDARKVGSPPGIPLHRPHDGQPATELCVVRSRFASLVLPVLAPQHGELRLFIPHTSHGLLLNTAHSPLLTFLLQATQRKVTDAQLHAELSHGVLSTPWRDLDVTQKRLVTAFLQQHDHVDRMLGKSSSLLAHLVAWCREEAAGQSTDKPVGAHNVSQEVMHYVLYQLPFDAVVGQFMRELIVQNAITEEVFCAWLDHYCERAMKGDSDTAATPVSRMFVLLVQFALINCEWQLAPELQQKFSTVRTRAR